MRLLDRYLVREFLMPLGVCLSGFLIFWVGFDLVSELADYQRDKMTWGDVAELYWVRMPEMLLTVLPVALLLALLYAVTQHARHHELTAIRAAGIGWWRLCLPYLSIGAMASLGLYALNEVWFPDAVSRGEQIRKRHAMSATERVWKSPVNFHNQAMGRHWSIGAFQLESGELRFPSFREYLTPTAHRMIAAGAARWSNGFWETDQAREVIYRAESDPEPGQKDLPWMQLPLWTNAPEEMVKFAAGSWSDTNGMWHTNLTWNWDTSGPRWSAKSLDVTNGVAKGILIRMPLGSGAQRLVQAASGTWDEGRWKFREATEMLYRTATDGSPMVLKAESREFPELEESPSHIRSEIKIGGRNAMRAMKKARLSVREIVEYRKMHPQLRREDEIFLTTQYHARLAGPWTCLVVMLIGIPFGAPSARRNVFFGVAGSLGLAFGYFVVQRLGFALGQKGALDPWLGAWLPNLSFGALGLWLMTRLR